MALPRFSDEYGRLPGYALADIPAVLEGLRARGIDVLDMGAGDSNLPPPPGAVAALRDAATDATYSRYAFQAGLPELRNGIASWMEKRFGVLLD
ncbi:MAG: LL-diaminopimelate aminotransferase, partial [Gemmatimonadota bacterium]